MSNNLANPLGEQSGEVILRGFQDEPVVARVVSVGSGRVEVAGKSMRHTLSYPKEWVFSYDESAFAEMRRAYESSDSVVLQKLWRNLDHYV